jgi:tetratricopeptide (TPR) repeat protein
MVNLAISLMKNGNLGVNPEVLLIEAEKIYMQHLPETFDTQAYEHADNIVLFDGLLPTAIVNSQLGKLYVQRGDDPLAAKYYRFLEKLYRMGNVISDDLAVNTLENLAVIYWKLDMFKSAEDFLQQALKIRNNKDYYAASDDEDDIKEKALKLELDSLRRREKAPSRVSPEWEKNQRKKNDEELNAKNFQY